MYINIFLENRKNQNCTSPTSSDILKQQETSQKKCICELQHKRRCKVIF